MAYQSQKLQLSKSVSFTRDVESEFCKWLDEDYFFFVLSSTGQATAFRSEMGQDVLFYVKAHLPRLRHSTTVADNHDRDAVRPGLFGFCQKPDVSRYLAPLGMPGQPGVSGFERGPAGVESDVIAAATGMTSTWGDFVTVWVREIWGDV